MELSEWKPYGYYKIVQKEDAPDEFKQRYPKVAYILFYLAKGKQVCEPFGKDVISVQKMKATELLKSKGVKHKMLLAGVELYINQGMSI